MAHSASLLKFLIVPAVLLLGGAAQAQQASFMVSVTLHSASKAVASMQLCPEGRPLDLLAAAAVRVDCPAGMNDKTTSNQNARATNPGSSPKPSEVLVTF